jgi:hypothetical protein
MVQMMVRGAVWIIAFSNYAHNLEFQKKILYLKMILFCYQLAECEAMCEGGIIRKTSKVAMVSSFAHTNRKFLNFILKVESEILDVLYCLEYRNTKKSTVI